MNEDTFLVWVLTADVEVDGVAPLPVRVLKAAVESAVAQGHSAQYQPGTLQTVVVFHIGPVHLPWHRRVIVQEAALHGHITAYSLVLVPSNWKQRQRKRVECEWYQELISQISVCALTERTDGENKNLHDYISTWQARYGTFVFDHCSPMHIAEPTK